MGLDVLEDHLLLLQRLEAVDAHIGRLFADRTVGGRRQVVLTAAPLAASFEQALDQMRFTPRPVRSTSPARLKASARIGFRGRGGATFPVRLVGALLRES